jgi:hypothetical protein
MIKSLALMAGATLLGGVAANAAIVSLNFAGVANPNNTASVDGFYNGGTSSDGNSGTNYGVTFSSNALAIDVYNGCCEPDSPTPGILFFLDGPSVTLDYSAGFDTGFSFYYASNTNAFINVYSGLDATGDLLATLSLDVNYDPSCGYCTWTPIGVSFAGTAHSIDFGGAANFVGFDDITFGHDSPVVPEPASWALMIAGFGMVGTALRRRHVALTA